MLSLEEKEIRRNQIGASEVYKLLNFDTQEAQDLWELKIGLQDYQEIDNDSITAGNILEEDCLKFYEKSNNVCNRCATCSTRQHNYGAQKYSQHHYQGNPQRTVNLLH